MKAKIVLIILICFTMVGCASVDVTKTAKGSFDATDPNEVDILLTIPNISFIELGTVTVEGFSPSDTAKMHNAIRAKAAPLGANAVIIKNEGFLPGGLWGKVRWATGVAIRFK